jgi:D-alanyl-D-alanine dipeptidase
LQHYNRIFVSPAYFKQKIKGALPIISVREGVLNSLLKLLDLLPTQYGIIVYDGYRPISVQQALYDDFYKKVKNKVENKDKTQEELEKITKMFVSIPSRDLKKPSTHNTGGAVDFAICDSFGIQLNFGCDFDDFRLIANTMYFEDKLKNNEELSNLELEAMLNRRVLFNLAINSGVGLQPYDGEWWHFDKNNQWDLKLDKVLYGSCEFVEIKSN